MSTYDSFLDDPRAMAAFHEVKGDVCARHLEECREFLGPVASVPDTVQVLVSMAKTLAAFARTAPGRLPSSVEIACREIEGLPK